MEMKALLALGMIIVCAMAAYWGMTAGLCAVFSRFLMAALAVAAGDGFAGPLVQATAIDSKYLHGSCLVTIAVTAYLLQRKLADFCLAEPDLDLPGFVDRLGGATGGLAIALMALGCVGLAVTKPPLLDPANPMQAPLEKASYIAEATARCVWTVGGKGNSDGVPEHAREDSNLQPSGPKPDALSN